MVYQQLNLCGLAGSAVGKPPLWFLVACVVYVFDVYVIIWVTAYYKLLDWGCNDDFVLIQWKI